jgi:hypothetical protein
MESHHNFIHPSIHSFMNLCILRNSFRYLLFYFRIPSLARRRHFLTPFFLAALFYTGTTNFPAVKPHKSPVIRPVNWHSKFCTPTEMDASQPAHGAWSGWSRIVLAERPAHLANNVRGGSQGRLLPWPPPRFLPSPPLFPVCFALQQRTSTA